MQNKISRALVSVSDKTGIVEFCRALSDHGIALLSTGGTAKTLLDAGIEVIEVSDYTGFPEMMAGRVKTLHPKIHGGILGRRGLDDAVMAEHNINPIDLVVVNLYPFEQTVSKPDCSFAEAIENIDIGGPAMLRSAAKNHDAVAVVVDPCDYGTILGELNGNGGTLGPETRFRLAAKCFSHTARYDTAIANYLEQRSGTPFPTTLNLQFYHRQTLRYGENPHQQAAFYSAKAPESGTLAAATQLQGKALSYNNIADADAALECVKAFTGEVCCVIVKHANPCGVAVAKTLHEAYDLAYQTDPTSAFGGIIACSAELDGSTAQAIIDRQFVEVIIAPSISAEARRILEDKPNIRLLACGPWQTGEFQNALDFKRIGGGLLVQDQDLAMLDPGALKIVTRRAPTAQEHADLLFVWKVAKFVKSNAIVYGQQGRTIGIGAGQMSRVYSAKLAGIKAHDENLEVKGSVMASDAFFPFRDSIDAAAAAGITAIIQPGGSMRDEETITAADEYNIAMVFTGMRHFRH